MARSVSAGLQTHITEGGFRLVWCWRITRKDGTVHAWTEHDEDLIIDADGDGDVTYRSAGLINQSSAESINGTTVSSASVQGLTTLTATTGIPLDDILAEKLDGAKVIAFRADWDNPDNGAIAEYSGYVRTIEWDGRTWNLVCESTVAKFNQTITESLKPTCPLDFMGTKCGVKNTPDGEWQSETSYLKRAEQDAKIGALVEPTVDNGFWYEAIAGGTSGVSEPTWSTSVDGLVTDGDVIWRAVRKRSFIGTVSVVTSSSQVTATGITVSADYFKRGVVTWLTGNNTGLKNVVIDDDGSGVIKFLLPTRRPVQVGDTFTILRGCDRTIETCGDVFYNVLNNRSFPYVPGQLIKNKPGTK